MAKIILSLDGVAIEEFVLDKARTTIGRRSNNDIQVNSLEVSGEHAAVVALGLEHYVEDLDSTNGTQVNGITIKKHLLQHGDSIALGNYQLKYINDVVRHDESEDFEKTMIIRPQGYTNKPASVSAEVSIVEISKAVETPPAPPTMDVPQETPKHPFSLAVASSLGATGSALQDLQVVTKKEDQQMEQAEATELIAKIIVLSGNNAGRELVIHKTLTTLGKPGEQVAVITKRPNGFFVTHVGGERHPTVNGASIGLQAHHLAHEDVLEVADVQMRFLLGA